MSKFTDNEYVWGEFYDSGCIGSPISKSDKIKNVSIRSISRYINCDKSFVNTADKKVFYICYSVHMCNSLYYHLFHLEFEGIGSNIYTFKSSQPRDYDEEQVFYYNLRGTIYEFHLCILKNSSSEYEANSSLTATYNELIVSDLERTFRFDTKISEIIRNIPYLSNLEFSTISNDACTNEIQLYEMECKTFYMPEVFCGTRLENEAVSNNILYDTDFYNVYAASFLSTYCSKENNTDLSGSKIKYYNKRSLVARVIIWLPRTSNDDSNCIVEILKDKNKTYSNGPAYMQYITKYETPYKVLDLRSFPRMD